MTMSESHKKKKKSKCNFDEVEKVTPSVKPEESSEVNPKKKKAKRKPEEKTENITANDNVTEISESKKKTKKKSKQENDKVQEVMSPLEPDESAEVGHKKKKRKRKHEEKTENESETSNNKSVSDSNSDEKVKSDKKKRKKDKAINPQNGEDVTVNEQKQDTKEKSSKKDKKKKKKEKNSGENNSEKKPASDLALKYLNQWKKNKINWHFQKVRQVWLLQHLYSQLISDKDFVTVLEYLDGLKGIARHTTSSLAEDLIRKSEDSDEENDDKNEPVPEYKLERARQVVQLLLVDT